MLGQTVPNLQAQETSSEHDHHDVSQVVTAAPVSHPQGVSALDVPARQSDQAIAIPCLGVDRDHGADLVLPVPVSQHCEVVVSSTEQSCLNDDCGILNPEAEVFQTRDPDLVHQGQLVPNLVEDWSHVQQVQAGGVGEQGCSVNTLWRDGNKSLGSELHTPCSVPSQVEPTLPFQLVDDISDILGLAPKQIQKVSKLRDTVVEMPAGKFIDKVLPEPRHRLEPNNVFTADYYVALHNVTAAPGVRGDGTMYPSFTPNHIGARVALPHVKLKISRWRYHLLGYENADLVQYLEYGFPLGSLSS